MEDRIDKRIKRSNHIQLFCINHPDKRWHTKNIGWIGARTIFYNLMSLPDMGSECQCSSKDLRPVESLNGYSTEQLA